MTQITLSTALTIRLTVGVAETLRVKELFDVMALPIELARLYELRTKPAEFLKVVYEMLDQSRSFTISFEQFSELVTDAEAYESVWEAFATEVTDFFRGPMRPVITTMFEALEKAEAERVADLMATIQASLSAIEPNSPGESSGGSAESLEQMCDLTHCDSLTIWPPDDGATSGTDMLDCVPSPPTATDPNDSLLSALTISTPTETRRAS